MTQISRILSVLEQCLTKNANFGGYIPCLEFGGCTQLIISHVHSSNDRHVLNHCSTTNYAAFILYKGLQT